MTRRISAEPTLYDADEGAPATLHGRRCSACGRAFFPPQDYGCEACGAPAELLLREEMPGAGTLVASAAVTRHPLAPFTVGIVVLDAGPAIRALMEASDRTLLPGTRVRANLVATGESGGDEVLELRFVASEA